ncbi:MAG: 5-formyltetrahydrofolate cyclo-ligase [Bacteroidales bacterium]|nr:5-formyltetrahydrofolate cyclo-ligase [Bacteroidales bacterium]
MDKQQLRKEIRAEKRAMPPAKKELQSQQVMARVEQLPAFNSASVVLLYWSMDDEVATHSFVDRWYRSKTLLLPCVDGDLLRLRQYTGATCMQAGPQFGIGEPTGKEYTELQRIDLIVVPGVAFDRECNRMGRGRGFYDRLLSTTERAIKIGVGFDFQLLDTIPTEAHDIRMNFVVTPREIISRK